MKRELAPPLTVGDPFGNEVSDQGHEVLEDLVPKAFECEVDLRSHRGQAVTNVFDRRVGPEALAADVGAGPRETAEALGLVERVELAEDAHLFPQTDQGDRQLVGLVVAALGQAADTVELLEKGPQNDLGERWRGEVCRFDQVPVVVESAGNDGKVL